jgi:hypothetical protein
LEIAVPLDFSKYNDSFLNLLDSETIYYLGGGTTTTGGAFPGRAITALVDRQPNEAMPAAQGNRPVFQVYVQNDATDGISASELDTASDALRIARRVGGSLETFRVMRVAIQDNGMLQLEVR